MFLWRQIIFAPNLTLKSFKRPPKPYRPHGRYVTPGVKLALCPLGVQLSPWDEDPLYAPPLF
jgi:hypothetical protein